MTPRPAVALTFLCGVLVATVAAPLATYTTSLALFGLAHVLSELNYIDRRFSARLGSRVVLAIGLPIAVAVSARVAAMLSVLSPTVSVTVELAAAAALALAAATRMRRFRIAGAAVGLGLAGCAAAAPSQLLLVLALLHNLTPLGFFAEALSGKPRRRALIPLALALIGLPVAIATGFPRAALQPIGLFLPEARLLASGPLALNLGLFVPASLASTDWAVDAFSAAVFAQIMHYAAVIVLLPRLAERRAAPTWLPWPGGRRLTAAIAAATASLALLFVLDYALARQLYASAALVHAWVEIPILLLAVGGLPAQPETA